MPLNSDTINTLNHLLECSNSKSLPHETFKSYALPIIASIKIPDANALLDIHRMLYPQHYDLLWKGVMLERPSDFLMGFESIIEASQISETSTICLYASLGRHRKRFPSRDITRLMIKSGRGYPWKFGVNHHPAALLRPILAALDNESERMTMVGNGKESLLIRAMQTNALDIMLLKLSDYISADNLKKLLIVLKDDQGLTALHYCVSRHDIVCVLPMLKKHEFRDVILILNSVNKLHLLEDALTSISPKPYTAEILFQLLMMKDQGLVSPSIDMVNAGRWKMHQYISHLKIDYFIQYFFKFLPENNHENYRKILGNEEKCLRLISELRRCNRYSLLTLVASRFKKQDFFLLHPKVICKFFHAGRQLNRSLITIMLSKNESRAMLEGFAKKTELSFAKYLSIRLAICDWHCQQPSPGLTFFPALNKEYEDLISDIENQGSFEGVNKVLRTYQDNVTRNRSLSLRLKEAMNDPLDTANSESRPYTLNQKYLSD